MSFNLRVSFTGLVGFAEISDPAPPKACALLLDGQQPRRGLDGTVLCRHRSFLRFPIDTISESESPGESLGLWYLDRKRVSFDVTEDTTNRPQGLSQELPLELRQMALTPGNPHPEQPNLNDAQNRQSLTWLLSMRRLFPTFQLHPDALTESPPPEANVGTQVIIDRGTLATRNFTRTVWECDSTLSGRPYRQVFSHEVDLFLPNLIAAKVVATSFDDGVKPRVLDLGELPKNTDNEVEIRIVNLCETNPLEWAADVQPVPDQDTKWFFELLDPALKEDLRKRLADRELPIPRPVADFDTGLEGQGSTNCIPIKLT